jgi:hypothetical protein
MADFGSTDKPIVELGGGKRSEDRPKKAMMLGKVTAKMIPEYNAFN